MRKKVIKYIAVFALLFQISLLIYAILKLKGGVEEEVHITFLRITLLIGSAMMVILTRYFLRFINLVKASRGILLIMVISLLPAIVIPAGGFAFAYKTNSSGEYILFFVIGLYHLLRYYPLLIKI
uniref:Uncharacterized protein n=1 Tax=candidate division WOR-3 bacterium TaxID=2052148 RepID=A0A7V3ZZ72_UNCW3